MRKVFFLTMMTVAFIATIVLAENLVVVSSSDKTSKDIPLKFELEKTVWDGEDLKVWGVVSNNSNGSYKFVKVIFTARDYEDRFIGRQSWHVDPSGIGQNEVGYIEGKHIGCEGRRPDRLEFSVVGRM